MQVAMGRDLKRGRCFVIDMNHAKYVLVRPLRISIAASPPPQAGSLQIDPSRSVAGEFALDRRSNSGSLALLAAAAQTLGVGHRYLWLPVGSVTAGTSNLPTRVFLGYLVFLEALGECLLQCLFLGL